MQVNKTSHCSMGTTFSQTDMTQLQGWASSGPYYLSVVVNNRMEFTAKVAIKSTEKLTGYSFFRDLKGKTIKSGNKVVERDPFEIIEVEVEANFPGYMLEVGERLKNIQNYTSNTGFVRNYTATGNSRANKKVNDYLDKRQHQLPFASKRVYNEDLMIDAYDKQQLNSAIRLYCTDKDINLTAAECAANIKADLFQMGIPIASYVEYLTGPEIILSGNLDLQIVNLLEK